MKFENGMLCPVCECGQLSVDKKNIEFDYKGRVRSFVRPVYTCSECDEEFLDARDQKEIDKKLTDSRRQIDGLLTSEEIRKIRQKLGYTQMALAQILQVGEKNFARYENGQATQGRAMDHLLRLLDHYPESIRVIGGQYPMNQDNVIH